MRLGSGRLGEGGSSLGDFFKSTLAVISIVWFTLLVAGEVEKRFEVSFNYVFFGITIIIFLLMILKFRKDVWRFIKSIGKFFISIGKFIKYLKYIPRLDEVEPFKSELEEEEDE